MLVIGSGGGAWIFYFRIPGSLPQGNYQKLHVKCEDWARQKRLVADAQVDGAMGAGGVDNVNDDVWEGERKWNDARCVDDNGPWRPTEQLCQ
eukprot:818617-Pyramimonas_sp.AAC.2